MFIPRPAQKRILEYSHGLMGIQAVPGSGKTHTLSYLAAKLILSGALRDEQEILVVTLVNSAVENFSTRIAAFIKSFGLLAHTGYRVRTLHSLAHEIVRERPSLAGLSNDFQIIDERETGLILNNIVSNWLHIHPDFLEQYANPNQDKGSHFNLEKNFELLLVDTATSFIRLAKDYQETPISLAERLDGLGASQDLLGFGLNIYEEYHRALHYRSALDFDDLIRLALRSLEADAGYLDRLRNRWPFILEDEAQDSSRLQERILNLLVGPNGNWVRVGDPNQAIFETFTTAHPKYLLNFINRPDVIKEELPNSGRSSLSIIGLANHLITWSRSDDNPNPELRDTLSYPLIDPAPPNDPQPNPPDQPDKIYLYERALEPEKELELVAVSLSRWLPDNQDKTVAILVPRNERGAKMVEALQRHRIQPLELLRSSISTRQTADILASVLQHLSEPSVTRFLADAYRKIKKLDENPAAKEMVNQVHRILRDCRYPERLLWPENRQTWLDMLSNPSPDDPIRIELEAYCELIRKWHRAAVLPIGQLVLTISLNIFHHPVDLALAYKLALSLETTAQNHPEWFLPQFSNELQEIALNRRKFYGFSSEDTGFDPAQHKGKVVVTTIHKAKGLEWDRVYIISVNQYDFPFGQSGDQYIGEKWFVKGKINLQEETLARLKALVQGDRIGLYLEEGEATNQARIEYAQERLRLFFVGITRAKSELIVTWNTGKSGGNQPSVPLRALIQFWKQQHVTTD